jgi:hypothetical protein
MNYNLGATFYRRAYRLFHGQWLWWEFVFHQCGAGRWHHGHGALWGFLWGQMACHGGQGCRVMMGGKMMEMKGEMGREP